MEGEGADRLCSMLSLRDPGSFSPADLPSSRALSSSAPSCSKKEREYGKTHPLLAFRAQKGLTCRRAGRGGLSVLLKKRTSEVLGNAGSFHRRAWLCQLPYSYMEELFYACYTLFKIECHIERTWSLWAMTISVRDQVERAALNIS